MSIGCVIAPMLSFPCNRESTPRRWTLHEIPVYAGMTVSLTRGRAGKMLAKKTRIYDLAMQASCLQFCRLEAGATS